MQMSAKRLLVRDLSTQKKCGQVTRHGGAYSPDWGNLSWLLVNLLYAAQQRWCSVSQLRRYRVDLPQGHIRDLVLRGFQLPKQFFVFHST